MPDRQSSEGPPLRGRDSPGGPVTGAVLADYVRSIAWVARNAEIKGAAPAAVLDEVRAKIAALIGID